MKTKLAIAFLLASVLPAVAAPAPAPLIVGHGANSCTDFSEGRLMALQVENSYYDWAQGYMSALNTMLSIEKSPTHSLARITDDNQKKALQAYCTAHPADAFMIAVTKVFFNIPETPAPKP
jgi:hypothetical protein